MIGLFNNELYGITRCPHCGVAKPLMTLTGPITFHRSSTDLYQNKDYYYFTTKCSHCDNLTLFYGSEQKADRSRGYTPDSLQVEVSYPALDRASEELPDKALKFFQQALESRHAPDGALMLAASAIDAMLKDRGYKEGTLYNRIRVATDDAVLTEEMAQWAHTIRLSANEPRHADDNYDGATPDDAEQIIAFTRALGEYLYVLPARVARWKKKADPSEQT